MNLTAEKRGKILWYMTFAGIPLAIPSFYLMFTESPHFEWFQYIPIYYMAFVVFLHSLWKLGRFRGVMLWVLAGLVGFVFEWFGLRFSTTFGGGYEYIAGQLSFLTVPVEVIIFWGVFIYLGYSLTSGILEAAGISKPTAPSKRAFFMLLLLVLLDGLIVAGLDMIMDPVMVHMGKWAWTDGGPYFNIPTGNFIGWFVITLIVSFLFRTYEYFKPANFDRISKYSELIPTVSYLNFMLVMGYYAYSNQMYDLHLLSFFIMLPVVLVSFILFFGSAISSRSYYRDK